MAVTIRTTGGRDRSHLKWHDPACWWLQHLGVPDRRLEEAPEPLKFDGLRDAIRRVQDAAGT